jgi:adenosylcobinamide kinase / adenosylcobinamide-phosphate guanylyltransferase
VRTLALGGIRSGKSQWAETAMARAVQPGAPVRYLATGSTSADPDWSARVSAHRRRRPEHWLTVETVDVTTQLNAPVRPATLVDDMGGWLVAAMDRRDAWSGGSVARDVDELVAAVDDYRVPLVLVSPEVGLSVVPATESGRLFADALGTLNQRLAAVCERVVLVIAGQELIVKESK